MTSKAQLPTIANGATESGTTSKLRAGGNMSLASQTSAAYGNKDEYLQKRMLMPAYANSFHVWGFVVGAVISGEFSGFNAGYVNGIGSMIVAHIFASLLMISVSLNLTELATAMPFASGCAAYASAAFNGAVACVIGYAYTFDMVFIGGEVTNFIGLALQLLFNTQPTYNVLYYFLTILICHGINFYPKAFFNIITASTAISCALVIIPLLVVSPQFDFSQALTTMVLSADGTMIASTDFLPNGFSGVINCFPLALYLLICFESMPCCVEETVNIKTSIPRGMLAANVTLLVISWIALVVCAGMPPGVSLLSAAVLPYSNILAAVFNMTNTQGVTLISLPSIFASQLAIYYAATRYIYGLSRGGYLPPILSLTTARGAPYTAMMGTSFLFVVLSLVLQYSPASNTASTFVTMGTIFALTAYILQPIIYIRLKFRLPGLPRPFNMKRSGVIVAAVNIVIAIGALTGLIYLNALWQWCVLGIVIAYVLTIPFYLLAVRPFLKDSPEKLFIKRQLDTILRSSVGNSTNSSHASASGAPGANGVKRPLVRENKGSLNHLKV